MSGVSFFYLFIEIEHSQSAQSMDIKESKFLPFLENFRLFVRLGLQNWP